MALQIFGIKKCQISRKAERFFKDRAIPYHFIDLMEKGISKGELEAVARSIGMDSLMDKEGKAYKDRGLEYMDYDVIEEILAMPELLKTPVIRNGPQAVIGDKPEAWLNIAKAVKKG